MKNLIRLTICIAAAIGFIPLAYWLRLQSLHPVNIFNDPGELFLVIFEAIVIAALLSLFTGLVKVKP